MNDFLGCVCFITVVAVISLIICISIDNRKHNIRQKAAMEVYRGNTKLQYTIVDSVKVDSCVMFLNK